MGLTLGDLPGEASESLPGVLSFLSLLLDHGHERAQLALDTCVVLLDRAMLRAELRFSLA